tara:strand:+ start:436 stop:600 length:165 start_codon:yes stop_codon:yes gene_type:complete
MKKSSCLLIILSLIISQKAFAQSTEEPKTNVFFIAIEDLNDWTAYMVEVILTNS